MKVENNCCETESSFNVAQGCFWKMPSLKQFEHTNWNQSNFLVDWMFVGQSLKSWSD